MVTRSYWNNVGGSRGESVSTYKSESDSPDFTKRSNCGIFGDFVGGKKPLKSSNSIPDGNGPASPSKCYKKNASFREITLIDEFKTENNSVLVLTEPIS
jgi:hypothetical protein